MSSVLRDTLTYTPLPVLATIGGAILAAVRPPGPRTRSAVQHYAAGVVFAAVAGELLPEIKHDAPLPVSVGFALGIALLLLVRHLTDEAEPTAAPTSPTGGAALPTGLLIATGLDVALDGVLLGIGFAVGATQGVLLTIALTLEVLFLGLSTAAALSANGLSPAGVIGIPAGIAGLLALGALVGALVFGGLTGTALFAGVLGFAAAALLYLVTEELLVEAHETPETPAITAMFFAGFLTLLVVEMLA